MSITASPKPPKKGTKYTGCVTAPICAKARSFPRGPNASRIATTTWPNNFTFGIYVHGELFSSIRVSVLAGEWRGSPSSEMFTDMLHPELDRGKIIIDPTRFVADPDKARLFPELPYVTVRLGYVACAHFSANIGLANVRPEHRAFYRKVFLQEPWGEPRLYPGLIKPVGLMAARYPEIRERVFQRFPYMRSSAFERRMLFERPGKPFLIPVSAAEPPSIVRS